MRKLAKWIGLIGGAGLLIVTVYGIATDCANTATYAHCTKGEPRWTSY